MSDGTSFIKIKRIITDRETKKNTVKSETIAIKDVRGFREWHKGKNDGDIEGDITMVIIDQSSDKKPRTILINESEAAFSERISASVPVK